MTITVMFETPELDRARVHFQPSWPARRLLRRRPHEDFVIAVPAIDGGRLWISDFTGRRVRDRAIVRAIELQRARLNSDPFTRGLRGGFRMLDGVK